LCCSRHGICVDLDFEKEVCISPAMSLRRCVTEFHLHAASHQVCKELSVRVAGGNMTIGVIRLVVQGHVACIGVKDCYHLGLGPVGNIVSDEVNMKQGGGQIAFER
jgi:hypothetical protein